MKKGRLKLNIDIIEHPYKSGKIYIYGTDVVQWSRALDIRLSDWCCSASMV
jgi:hypothetical protein